MTPRLLARATGSMELTSTELGKAKVKQLCVGDNQELRFGQINSETLYLRYPSGDIK